MIEHTMAHVLIYPTSWVCPTHSILSLPKQLLPFPLFRVGWKKIIPPHNQHRDPQRKLTGHCQWAEDIFTCPRVQRRDLEFALWQPGSSLLSIAFYRGWQWTESCTHRGTESKPSPEEQGTRALSASSGLQGGKPLFQATLIQINGMKANRSQKNSN